MNFLFPNKIFPRLRQNGSVLILALTMLVLLSLMAFSVGYTVRQKLQVTTRLEIREKLRLAADAVTKQASIKLSEMDQMGFSSHALSQAWASSPSVWKGMAMGDMQCSVTGFDSPPSDDPALYGLMDEDRNINLNTAKPQVLQKLFETAAGVDSEKARRIAAAIRDWIDEDDDLNDGGAESKDYSRLKNSYSAKNAPFDDLQELLWVQGVTPEMFGKVRPYLTLDGAQVNLNTAPAPVLIAMGLSPAIVEKIILFRKGKDGKQGTADDGVFQSLSEAPDVLSRYLYFNPADRDNLSAAFASGFAVNSAAFQAQIECQPNHRSERIHVKAVLDKQGEVKRWYEEFF